MESVSIANNTLYAIAAIVIIIAGLIYIFGWRRRR